MRGSGRPGVGGAGPGENDINAGNEISVRFGPGVTPEDTDELVRTWRAGQQQRTRRRPGRAGGVAGGMAGVVGALVTVAVVGAALLWLLLRGQGSGAEVTGLKVRAPQATQHCDATVDVLGVLTTNGKRGEISYRWLRSDGNESGALSASVEKGRREVTVPLHWTVTGQGKLHAVATLELLSPGESRRASAAFDYLCR